MNIEEVYDFCLSIPETSCDMPFGENTIAFRVDRSIFALIMLNNQFFMSVPHINLKSDPLRAIELREQHSGIIPAYHMNKRLWMSVPIDDSIEDGLLKRLIMDSLNEVIKNFSKKKQELYNERIFKK